MKAVVLRYSVERRLFIKKNKTKWNIVGWTDSKSWIYGSNKNFQFRVTKWAQNTWSIKTKTIKIFIGYKYFAIFTQFYISSYTYYNCIMANIGT